MYSSKPRLIVSLLLMVFVVSSLMVAATSFIAGASDQDARKDNLKSLHKYLDGWLNSPIKYIITKEEEKNYKLKLKLKKRDEQLRFIEFFWRRRDPDPNTPKSEYQDEFFRRVAHTNKFFKIGKRPGWDCQRGQVYIVFGPPSEIQKGIRQETWTYYNLPSDRIPQNFSIIFADLRGNNDYRISGTMYPGKDAGEAYMDERTQRALSNSIPREVSDALNDVNQNMIWNPNLNYEDVPPPPQYMFDPDAPLPKKESAPRPKPSSSEPPFNTQQVFFQGKDSKVEMLVEISLPFNSFTFRDEEGIKTAEIQLKALLMDQNQSKVDDFNETITLVMDPLLFEEKIDDTFRFWQGLQAEPGNYILELVSDDKIAQEKRELKGNISIPQLESTDPVLTSIIPAYAVSPSSGRKEDIPTGILHILGYDISPNLEAVFSKQDNLCLFFQLLNVQSGSDIEINCYIFKDEKIFKPLKLQPDNLSKGKSGEIIIQICIPLEDFPAGDYDVVVQAKDETAGKEAVKKFQVKIKE